MSEEYKRGQRDGLRLALTVLAAEEAKWSGLLGESRSWRTQMRSSQMDRRWLSVLALKAALAPRSPQPQATEGRAQA